MKAAAKRLEAILLLSSPNISLNEVKDEKWLWQSALSKIDKYLVAHVESPRF